MYLQPSLNWVSIENKIRNSRIDFSYRILLLDTDNIYKWVAILGVFQCLYKQTNKSIGPTCRVLQSALCFDTLHLIIDAIENGGFCNMKNWKQKLVMLNLEYKNWEFTLELYGNMKIYKNVMHYDEPCMVLVVVFKKEIPLSQTLSNVLKIVKWMQTA